MTGRIEWDDPATAQYYEAFCRSHTRYAEANRALVAHADIAPGQRVLDFAAGTGRTAEAVLAHLGNGRVDCVEPASAMRSAGRRRLRDPRIAWHAKIQAATCYDRILCGAALWQLLPLETTLRTLHARLRIGGALVFNIPALYLGIPDPPGAGDDPYLSGIAASLAGSRDDTVTATVEPLPTPAALDHLLRRAGFSPRRWSFSVRLTQAAMRDWLKIPVLTNELLAGLDAAARARRIDEAWGRVDQASCKTERWLGWTSRRI